MKVKFVCLANSYKEHGRCVAGIEILNDEIVIENGSPKWIRPISSNPHGEIETSLVSNLNLLDIVEIEVTKNLPNGYQTENVLFDLNSINKTGNFSEEKLSELCNSKHNLIFGNRGKSVIEEKASELNYSLDFISVTEFEFYYKKYEDNPNSQLRIIFSHNRNQYDLPVTDPIFMENYKQNQKLVENKTEIYLVLSLGVIHKGWHYKLVAGIL